MTIIVVGVDIVVIVFPLLVTAVVWGIDIDAADGTAARERQRFKDVVVLAVDNDVIWTLPPNSTVPLGRRPG